MDLQAQLIFLHDTYLKYKSSRMRQPHTRIAGTNEDVGETFDVLKSQCDNCVRWTHVYRERADIRINLVSTIDERSHIFPVGRDQD
jgi:hypothetical protein